MVNFLHSSHIKHSKVCHKFIKFLNFSRPGRPFLNLKKKFSDFQFQDPVRNGHQKPMQIIATPMVWLFHKACYVQLSAAGYMNKQSIIVLKCHHPSYA